VRIRVGAEELALLHRAADQTPIAQSFFDFGDGSVAVLANSANQATHIYASPGTYTVTISVIDTVKNASSQAATVIVSKIVL
jgi:PKD repeat protein